MGIGKTRNEEQRNRTWETGDEKWALSFITACPLCIQEHLEQTSATGVSGARGSRDYSICISLIHKKVF